MTVEAVLARTKTVTRRDAGTWTTLRPGDRLTLIEKGMGLPRGAKQVVLADVEVVEVWVEALDEITSAECVAEGFPEMSPDQFIDMWLRSHPGQKYYDLVRAVVWKYLS